MRAKEFSAVDRATQSGYRRPAMSRRLAAFVLLACLAAPLGLSAGMVLHGLADHHSDDGLLGRAGAALAHGHWHELGAADHDAVNLVAPVAPFGASPRPLLADATGASAAPLPPITALVRATESPPPRPAGTALLHQLALLRI